MGQINLTRWIGIAGMVLLVSIFSQTRSHSQEPDTTLQTKVKTDTAAEEHSPRKAALLSATLPGLGQIYNNKTWKVPIIYAGAGLIYYAYDFNAVYYEEYKTAFTRYINGEIDEYNGITSKEGIGKAKDYYRRYRDMNILFMAGLYLVQIIDATVDAYLFNFDVSQDITLRFQPTPVHAKNNYVVPAVKCTINF